jgi:hypothetical protein
MASSSRIRMSTFAALIAWAAVTHAAVNALASGSRIMTSGREDSSRQGRSGGMPPGVTGSWELTIKPSPGSSLPPEFPGLVTFDEGGGCVETVILPPVTTAHGAWVRTSRRQFEFAIVHHLVDPGGNFVGTVRAKSRATFVSRDRFQAEFEGHLYAPDGSVVAPLAGTEIGVRIAP